MACHIYYLLEALTAHPLDKLLASALRAQAAAIYKKSRRQRTLQTSKTQLGPTSSENVDIQTLE